MSTLLLVGRRRGRLLLAAGALVAAFALPGGVSADTGGTPSIGPASSRDATISVDSLAVTGKVIVTARISVVCQPIQSYDWSTGETTETTDGSIESATLTILQAQGRTIDSGYAQWGGTAVCDGTTVNSYAVPVTASQSPWRNGAAVIGASVYIADRASFQDSDSASTGPLAVRLSLH
jgi:hypothetical protein